MIVRVLDMLAQVSTQELLAEGAKDDGAKTPWLLFCAGIAVIALMMLRLARKRLAASREREGLSVAERVEIQRNKPTNSRREQQQFVERISELMAELAELSRQINGQLETRLAQLEVTLQHADDKIQRLEALSGDTDRTVQTKAPDDLPPEQTAPATKVEVGDDYPTESGASETIHPLLLTGENRAVIELAEAGRSPREIAQETGRPIGEIELILSLGGKNSAGQG